MNRRELTFGLWEGKKLINVVRSQFLRVPTPGVVELFNRIIVDTETSSGVPAKVERDEIVAVIVLGQGQYVTLKDAS